MVESIQSVWMIAFKINISAHNFPKEPSFPAHFKRLAGRLVDPLHQFVGGVGAPLDVWAGPKDVLQHAEGQGVAGACRHRLTHHCTVNNAAPGLMPQFTCMPQGGDKENEHI